MRDGLDDVVRESLLSFSHKQVCSRTRAIGYALFVRSMQRRLDEERMDLPWPVPLVRELVSAGRSPSTEKLAVLKSLRIKSCFAKPSHLVKVHIASFCCECQV